MESALGGVQSGMSMLETSDSKQHLCPLPPLIPSTERQPVIRFQANIFTDAIVLAMTFSHIVFDGTGAAKILALLGRCCRDPSVTPLPLIIDEQDRAQSAIFAGLADTSPAQDHTAELGPAPAIHPVPLDAASLRTCRFEFNSERILQLKYQCSQVLKNACMFQPNSASIPVADLPPFLSSNDVLTSALADAIQRVKSQSKTYDCLDLCMAVNMRGRIELSAAREFLGNMACNLRLKTPGPEYTGPEQCLSCRKTHDCPIQTDQLRFLTDLACKVRNKVRNMDRKYFQSCMTYIANQKDWSQTGMIFTDLAFSSWRHLDIYGLDFGDSFGIVHNFDLSFGLIEGDVIFLPKRLTCDQKEAGWDVHITLPAKDLEALVKDDLIRWLMGRDGE
ncbi:hypothetical protein DTO013E5_8171 [Penicillium roqueforti]|nr:uncharacterized protein LCP9604111_4732 [Penicillium roqueforti]KAF9249016.1 hypothetical protein LCP9604111_4732 [Penicillium roqueforti]KAI2669811.1 hypothetical protein CBS147355_9660 [Penicillium roqueforti]KAI2673600.1 hypothetical protein LCP963914a_9046 [Penicillium roqueforti]KAI2700173.1 hypothetical protein CBS147372_5790 [Penicillium roqueforti]KAI2701367.1 hypothetical protein CBS147332_7969 [Penicillium roqueforti]